jgi:transcriptional regulator with PAS, ATPase and Fis domain
MIQVKLLRVLQERTFQRLGEAEPRTFRGKLISATNRDLARRMKAGEFREDLYYRLCSDLIATPSLRRRLDDDPQELRRLMASILERISRDSSSELCDEVLEVITARLGPRYAWPGNVRELEQCVRNVLVRRDYVPPRAEVDESAGVRERLGRDFVAAGQSADEMLRRYCTLAYFQTGSYEATAAKLNLDRRTVKAKVDVRLLEVLQRGDG